MPLQLRSRRAWWAACVLWITLCAGLFFALQGARDPSRPNGAVSERAASEEAARFLAAIDSSRYAKFEALNAALYKRKGSRTASWIILCGDPSRNSIENAVVVEVDAVTGAVIGRRSPGSKTLDAAPAAPSGGVK